MGKSKKVKSLPQLIPNMDLIPSIINENSSLFQSCGLKTIAMPYEFIVNELNKSDILHTNISVVKKVCKALEFFLNRNEDSKYRMFYHFEEFEELNDFTPEDTKVLIYFILLFGMSNVCILWVASDIGRCTKVENVGKKLYQC